MADMGNGKQEKEIWQQNIGVMETFTADYISITKVNLDTGRAVVLKSERDPDLVGLEEKWEDLVSRYEQKQAHADDVSLLSDLTLENLNEYYVRKGSLFPIELRCFQRDETYDWVRIAGSPMKSEKRELLITVRVANEERLMRNIVDLYVYRNCDFFVLVNARDNSYTMFSGKEGTPLPPAEGNDYEAEVRQYNQTYVAPEDLEETTANMMIDHVCKMLEKQDQYEFTTGFINDKGEYRRSRIQFAYFDREAGLIVTTRMDVTELYLAEGEKEQKLAEALRAAQHDPMTELYNKKAMTELVNKAIGNRYRAQSVMMFVDIDNFKLVNDTFGHQKGDEVLLYLARRLGKIAGKDGIAGRIGGDEFLVYLPANGQLSPIKDYADEICNVFASQTEFELADIPVSCSVGISVYPQDGMEYEGLLYKADQALYDAKRYGKCQYAFYSVEEGKNADRLKQKRE